MPACQCGRRLTLWDVALTSALAGGVAFWLAGWLILLGVACGRIEIRQVRDAAPPAATAPPK